MTYPRPAPAPVHTCSFLYPAFLPFEGSGFKVWVLIGHQSEVLACANLQLPIPGAHFEIVDSTNICFEHDFLEMDTLCQVSRAYMQVAVSHLGLRSRVLAATSKEVYTISTEQELLQEFLLCTVALYCSQEVARYYSLLTLLCTARCCSVKEVALYRSLVLCTASKMEETNGGDLDGGVGSVDARLVES